MYLSYMVFFIVFNHVRSKRMKELKAAGKTGKTEKTTTTAATVATSVGFIPPCVQTSGAAADQGQAGAAGDGKEATAGRYGMRERTPKKTK